VSETLPTVREISPLGALSNLNETLVIKEGNLFLVSLPDGGIPADEPHPLGLWFHDCRFLSAHELRICGVQPRLLMASDSLGTRAVHELTNPELDLEGQGVLPAQSLRLRLERTVDAVGVLRERITARSYHRAPLRITIELRLGADFEALLAVRGIVPRRARAEVDASRDGFMVVGRDGVSRTTALRMAPPPHAWDDGVFSFPVELAARGQAVLSVDMTISEHGAPGVHVPHARDARGPRVTSDQLLFNRIVERSLLDLGLLRSELDGHTYYAAGVPWYATLFGRDSILTAEQMLSFDPGIAETTLRLLASRLGRTLDDAREEEPGKVLHELRVGEPAALGETVFARYYGTVDATPLFLCLIGAHADWSGSLALFRELRGPIDAALGWIDHYGDLDGDGLVEYQRRSPNGLINQGWKDSRDGVPYEDGEPLRAPVALVEVQGYVIRAKNLLARLFERDGDAARARDLRSEADELSRSLDRFWRRDRGSYAIGLDADKRLGSALASNQGHLLWADAVSDEQARGIRNVLMDDAMFSGWGIRTLAESHPAYNPVGYHTGSVWPHDSAMIAFGLRRYGYDQDFTRIFEGLLEAASRFDHHRLPELFGGFARGELDRPVSYPVACQPQAWAAGSIPYLLACGLGLCPEGLDRRLRVVRPSLPRWLNRIEIRDLEVAGARVDLRFERGGEHVTLADASTDGDLEVVLERAAEEGRPTGP
jgi:glycogen debranching enzyme